MSYKHLNQTGRHQIYVLMKAGQNLKTTTLMLVRHKSTVSLEALHNASLRGYRPRQAEIICLQRAQASRNALQIDPVTRQLITERLSLQWGPEQIASSLPVSHETICQDVYADKAQGGSLCKHIRCQKKRRKRYSNGKSRCGQSIGWRRIA